MQLHKASSHRTELVIGVNPQSCFALAKPALVPALSAQKYLRASHAAEIPMVSAAGPSTALDAVSPFRESGDAAAPITELYLSFQSKASGDMNATSFFSPGKSSGCSQLFSRNPEKLSHGSSWEAMHLLQATGYVSLTNFGLLLLGCCQRKP